MKNTLVTVIMIITIAIFYFIAIVYQIEMRRKLREVEERKKRERQRPKYDAREDVLMLIAAVLKSDGAPKRVELQYVRIAFKSYLRTTDGQNPVSRIYEFFSIDYDVDKAASSFAHRTDHATCVEMLRLLDGIVDADDVRTHGEVDMIRRIGVAMQLSQKEIDDVLYKRWSYEHDDTQNRHNVHQDTATRSVGSCYDNLGIKPDVSDDEVKKAYHVMVKRYHPDRFATSSEDVQHAAAEQFMVIQDAYETICSLRGLK